MALRVSGLVVQRFRVTALGVYRFRGLGFVAQGFRV